MTSRTLTQFSDGGIGQRRKRLYILYKQKTLFLLWLAFSQKKPLLLLRKKNLSEYIELWRVIYLMIFFPSAVAFFDLLFRLNIEGGLVKKGHYRY